ncbi:MAG: LPS export ABC transporter ATP-binding protein [Thermovirgaceae bacterium]|jgi:lipopolysaccharide export system ATP-binding protein|nr:LPS export ABC transporter ATP-binding protein [Synergistales bacterium]MDI9393791.1 LPS export ABC transporter ATP-binding protein [Synergistota bacterium]NLV65616.1 LPS export ABC transporter ATP-binding protein [Synergistaceae bacterium]HRW88080.1 LPS export ABC transporter ATP-binding protein [Thermovirgaceae bacterium]MDD3831031.1 LPS export ABC transporter ATP-binding protein [Synergistales bacterium]
MSNRFLWARSLSKSYKGRAVVSSVSLKVKQGEIVGLLGPNGAGKTTTFYMVLGIVRPDSGRILIDNEDLTGQPMYIRARRGIGYLPQEASVFRSLSARENIELVLEERGKERKNISRMASDLIEEFGLGDVEDLPGFALSGGERRRVEIARSLAMEPSFILLDEPFSGIDPIAVYDIQQIILGLRTRGYGILLTDHSVRETLAITDRTYLIHRGQILVEGTPSEVADSDAARKFYLGERFSL